MKSGFVLLAPLLACGPCTIAHGSLQITSEISSHVHLQADSRETRSAEPDVEAPPLLAPVRPTQWFKEHENWFSIVMALLFVLMIGSLPLLLHKLGGDMSTVHIAESVCLYVWLFGGLYLFTNVILFQSPHFDGKIRTLDLRESVYFFSQIVTTVGYGDITPAKPRGRLFVGVSVLCAICLVAKMMSDVSSLVHEKVEKMIQADLSAEDVLESPKEQEDRHQKMIREAFRPVLVAGSVWLCFVAAGTCFFHFYPGEGKTWAEGVYMSMITLSSVGFGVFTPVTKGGMVFASYWMIGGCASLVSTIGGYIAFSDAIKAIEMEHVRRTSSVQSTA